MTETLTEQLQQDNLETNHYWATIEENGNIFEDEIIFFDSGTIYKNGEIKDWYDNKGIKLKGIVPTYEEHQALVDRVTELEKELGRASDFLENSKDDIRRCGCGQEVILLISEINKALKGNNNA